MFCDEQALPHLQESLEDILRVQPERIRAVGEIGLDARKGQPPQVLQEAFLREQLSFAGAHALPVSLHCVQAAQRLWEALRAEGIRRGAVHGFSAGRELARQFLDQGMYLGIGMAASRENARRVREAIAYAPLDRLLLEAQSVDAAARLRGSEYAGDDSAAGARSRRNQTIGYRNCVGADL